MCIANSRSAGAANTFGLAAHWNHSYNWILEDSASSTNQYFPPSSYTVDFPDGRVETFKQVNWDTANYYRVISAPPTLAPLGVRERFAPINPQNLNVPGYLILPDGGKVEFLATRKSLQKGNTTYWYYSYVTQAIIDPYGLRTNFAYNQDGTLQKVTEPAGRYLQFYYTLQFGTNVIDHVTEVTNTYPRRRVQFNYTSISPCGKAYTALLNEFLKEYCEVEHLKKDFQSKFVAQQKQIEELTARLQKVSAQVELTKPAPRTVLRNP